MGVVRLWGAGIVHLIVGLILAVYILSKGKTLIDPPLWKKTVRFALPLIPHYLGFAFLNGTDKLMINAMVGTDKAGIYSLAAVISTIGVLLWSALCVTVTPFVNEMLGQKNYRKISDCILPLLLLIGIVCVLVSLLAPEVIWVLGTKEYMEGIYVVPATVAGVFLHVVYDIFSNVSFFHKKNVRIMLATLFAAVLNIVLNYIFIQQYGYVAASYTTLLSFLLLAVLHYFCAKTIIHESILDLKKTLLLSAVVVAGCVGCSFLYEVRLLRYAFCLGLLAVIYLYRKSFIKSIVDMKV